MKVSYRQIARDDVVRQFRYYLVTLNVPKALSASGMPSSAPFDHCASILFWVRTIVPPVRTFRSAFVASCGI